MSILSAICENIHNCYPCEKWARLEGQTLNVSRLASRGQSGTAQDPQPCPNSWILSYMFPVELPHSLPYIMHAMRCLMQTRALPSAWQEAFAGAFPRRLARSGLCWAEDHLRGGTLIYCLSMSLCELQVQNSCHSQALKRLLHLWIIDRGKLSMLVRLKGIMLLAGEVMLSLACCWRGDATFPIPSYFYLLLHVRW